eukprot:3458002-Rhodomonas_salina.1
MKVEIVTWAATIQTSTAVGPCADRMRASAAKIIQYTERSRQISGSGARPRNARGCTTSAARGGRRPRCAACRNSTRRPRRTWRRA